MAETAAKPRVRAKKDKCDNHPAVDATLTSDGGGVHQTIHLCDVCQARLRRVH